MTKPLPHALDAEKAVLGGLLLRGEAIERLGAIVSQDFYDPRHGSIFAAALELHRQGRPIDLLTLETQLQAAGELQRVGGVKGLAELSGATPTAENIGHHARIVQEMAVRRRLIHAAHELAEAARREDQPPEALIQNAVAELDGCRGAGPEVTSIRQVLTEVWEETERRAAGDVEPDGVPTGLRVLDDGLTFGGLPREQVTILAGITSSGKSALANTCLLGAAQRGLGVLCCAFEDSPRAVVKRLLSRLSGIQNRQMQRAIIGPGEERGRFQRAVQELAGTRVAFLERVPPSIAELTGNISSQVRKQGIDLVIIDFLQLVQSGGRHRSRQEEVDHVFGELVAMARRLPAATLVVSQLRRTRGNIPTKEDLYHSGALEQWSHTIGILWRPDLPAFSSMVSLIIAKQKNGPTGRLTLGWNPELVSYCDPDPEEAERYRRALEELRSLPAVGGAA